MKKQFRSFLAIAVVTSSVLMAAAGGAQGAGAPAAQVKLTGLHKMVPDKVTIHVGDTVEWLNIAAEPHTVTADKNRAINPDDVSLPEGAEIFDSGDIPPGRTFTHTFTVPGAYHYVCLHHEEEGMLGEIDVE